MTTTITITTALAPAPMLSNDLVIIMLMISELMLVGVTILIAILALWGARSIKQGAENAARQAAQSTANAAMDNFLQPSNISGIVERHITERGEEVADLVAEKLAVRLYQKRQEQEQRDTSTPTPPSNEKTEENTDV